MTSNAEAISLFDRSIITRASLDSFAKLNPVTLARNPVIFVTEIVAALVTIVGIEGLLTGKPAAFAIVIAVWLWITVLFANLAEAVAEGQPQRHDGEADPRPARAQHLPAESGTGSASR